MAATKAELYSFLRQRDSAVVSTLGPDGEPQAARIYIAATSDLELIFYTLQTNRKCLNLRRNPRLAAVVGWDDEQTLQYEGIAFEVEGSALISTKDAFLHALPDRKQDVGWPGLTFFRVKPIWIRFSEYGRSWRVDEMTFPENKRNEESRPSLFRRLSKP
jgi:hypothetical protein